MSEFLANLNTWIIGHQALVVAVGVPLLSAVSASIVALMTNKASVRAAEKERQLHIQSKLADIETTRLNELRDDLTTLLTITFFMGEDPDTPYQTQVRELFRISKKIQLSLDLLDDTTSEVIESMNNALKAFLDGTDKADTSSVDALQMTAIKLLTSSWIKLKHELLSVMGKGMLK